MRTLLLVSVLLCGGCLRKTEFKCQTNDQCSSGGVCESTGYCSFSDSECPDGRRYGELSGDLGGQCVGGMAGVDGGVDGPLVDAAPGGCPASYMTVTGAGTHRYRVLAATGTWAAQKAACAADSTSAYLTVPNDQAELTALLAATTAARVWVGIDDQMTENTFVTTNGGTFAANDPLWDVGEPDNAPLGNGGGQGDCVVGVKASNQLADTRCDNADDRYPAICECDP